MSLKPWREVIVPHPDVLNDTVQQSEFAADLTAVHTRSATPEYGDAKSFYERTFITEGMGKLLTQVAQRLGGKGGEPVIQLQTSFGGGKTHTLLAVYHLATRQCALGDLSGIPALLDHAGLMDVPTANRSITPVDTSRTAKSFGCWRNCLEIFAFAATMSWKHTSCSPTAMMAPYRSTTAKGFVHYGIIFNSARPYWQPCSTRAYRPCANGRWVTSIRVARRSSC